MVQINDREFNKLTNYFVQHYGINLTKKRTLIESRLNNHLLNKGFSCYSDYLDYVFDDKTGNEVSQVVNILTTNFSYFMREWDHFRYFKEHVLPELENRIKDKDLRIWSAGCSTGQEPYTLAMLISDYFGDKRSCWDAKVLATDISLKALNTAVLGVYDDECLSNVPPSWKLAYFTKTDKNRWEAKQELKNEVIFRRFNLMEENFPFKKKFNVIFCRNVMIYFNEETKRKLIDKFYNALDDNGYLFIGQSESISRNETNFTYVMPSIYKKVVKK